MYTLNASQHCRDDALSGLVHPKRDPLVNHNLVLLLSALYEGKQGFLPADYDAAAQPAALKKDQVFFLL